MNFIIYYGSDGVGGASLPVEADTINLALSYAEQLAISWRESYEGLHGVQDFSEFCEENGYDEDSPEAWDDFFDCVQGEIFYSAEDFDEENIAHLDILEECEGAFWQI